MRAWLRSVLGQTTLVLIAGVVLSQLLALAIYAADRRAAIAGARVEAIARHVAAAAHALDEAPVAERRRLARALRRPGLRLFWGHDPLVRVDDGGWPARALRRALLTELDADGGEGRLRIALRTAAPPLLGAGVEGEDGPPAAFGGGPGRGRGDGLGPPAGDVPLVVGALRLADGSHLNFAARLVAAPPLWATPAFAAALATTLIVAAVALWAVRRAVRPLGWFARAAERLGADLAAPALAEGGPTEVRRLARAFNAMQQRLRRLVNDRTLMLAAVSHDLRTPLTRLRLRAELIDDDEMRRKTLADLDEMEAMLRWSLDFARDGATAEPCQRLDVAALVQTVCAEAEDAGADVGYAGPAHLAASGRPLALKRALANLVGNAVRYGNRARVTLQADDSAIRIDVDDDGPGIPESEREAVFRPFYRLEGSRSRETGGAGLGLAVVRAVIDGHGGRVTLANRDGGGLRASVVLPAAAEHGFPLSTR